MRAGIQIGPFSILHQIAQGAMGSVWKAQHRQNDAIVAIKFLLEEKNDDWSQNQFENEIQAIAGLNHRNICQILDHGEYEDPKSKRTIPFLTMEYIDGPAMFDLTGRISWIPLRRLILQLLDALAHAHARGFLHHDIKPSNVMLRRLDRKPWTDDSIIEPLEVVLMDFGLARAKGQIKRERYIQGTPAYMPPEQLRCAQHHYGPWTDLYSVGGSLWRLLTGSPPYGTGRSLKDYAIVGEKGILPPLKNQVAIPAKLEEWLHVILHKNPRTRFQLAADAARELRELRTADRMPFEPIVFDEDQTGSFITLKTPPPITDLTFSGRRTFVPTPSDWQRRYPPYKCQLLPGVGLNLFSLRRTPMVGRKQQCDKLWQLLKDVQSQGATLVSLTGVSGVGKSRMAEWLCERGEEFGCSKAIHLDCRPQVGISDIRSIMRSHLGIDELEPKEAEAHLLREIHPSEAIFRRITEILPLLHPENETLLDLGDESFREIWLDFLEHVSYRDPQRCRVVIVHIEDIEKNHEFLSFCEWLLEHPRAHKRPILILMPIRSEVINSNTPLRLKLAQIHKNTQSFRVSVPPLSHDEEAELIERSLGLSPSLTKKIIEQTKGIPQLSIQLINDLVMHGTLIPKSDGFVIADGKQIEIPKYLEQDWAEQIESAFENTNPEHVKSIETAAVFDNHINHDLWRKALSGHNLPYPNKLLNVLFNKNILKKWKNNRGFSFTHPLYSKIIRSNIDPKRLKMLHTSIADLLSPYTQIKQKEVRAFHTMRSECWSQALEQYGICLHKRIRESNDAAIEENLNQIKSIIAQANFPKASREEGIWLALQLRHHSHYGNWEAFDEILATLDQHLIKNQDTEIKIQRTTIVGWRLVHQGKIPSAIQHFQLGLRLADKIKESLPPMVKESVRRCHMGVFDAYSHVDRIDDLGTALHEARPYFSINDDRDHFLSYLHRGSFFYRRCGNFVKARQIADQALNLATKHGFVLHIAIAHNNIGDMAKEQSQFQSAKDNFNKAYRLFQQIGNVYALMALYNIGATLMLEQQIDEAADLFQQVLRKSSQRDFHLVLIYSHFQLLIVMAAIQDKTGWETHHFQLQGLLRDRRLLNKDLKQIILTVNEQTRDWSTEHSKLFIDLIREWLTDNHPLVAKLGTI